MVDEEISDWTNDDKSSGYLSPDHQDEWIRLEHNDPTLTRLIIGPSWFARRGAVAASNELGAGDEWESFRRVIGSNTVVLKQISLCRRFDCQFGNQQECLPNFLCGFVLN